MLYKVRAKIHEDKMERFWIALNNGTIESQKPDGKTMVEAMKHAKMIDHNMLEWYEACYCDTPLQHERQTIYDTYMYDFATELKYEIKDDIEGKSFWRYLEDKYFYGVYTY